MVMTTGVKRCLVWILSPLLLSLSVSTAGAVEKTNRTASTTENKLLLTGSSTMCPMMAVVGKSFHTLHPDDYVEVQCGGSERGIKDLKEGKTDIGMVSRVLANDEKKMFAFPIARDAISILVHKSNPVTALSNAQVVDIFTGKITNWKDVGGPDAAIAVVLREKQKSSTELFFSYFKLKGETVKGTVIPGDNPVTTNALASNPYAIGYVSSGHAERSAAKGILIKILPVNGVMPTSRNIITGNYPISRPLMLVTMRLPTGVSKKLIDFSLSSSIVDIIEKFDFVPYQD